MMNIGILTSSRADFGIYLQLLNKLKADNAFNVEIIAFGTHLSYFHGYTIDQIQAAGFEVKYTVESMVLTDSAASISTAMGLTSIKFAEFWNIHQTAFDLVFCLGDRYEMFAAVMAGVPFQIPFAHLHGGETTLGAIDNVFRHGISLASKYHFVSTAVYAQRIKEIIGTDENIFHVGALSLDNFFNIEFLSVKEFKDKWGIDISKPTILTTFHPETINVKDNEQHINELVAALNELTSYQILITMPNADTSGNIIRRGFIKAFKQSPNVFMMENLGSQSYFTAMKYCRFLLGNTSSGIIEAASANKYVINLGNRQQGRLSGDNVINTAVKREQILQAVKLIEGRQNIIMNNIYYLSGAADNIINVVKRLSYSKK